MKPKKISVRQRYDCIRTAVRGSFPCSQITATEIWLATISHEIKNPLTAIKTSAAILGKNPDDKKLVQKLSQCIMNSVEDMQKIIEELLDLSRLDAGTCSLNKEWTDAEIIGRKISERQSPIALTQSTQLIIKMEGVLYCDVDRVAQALMNLVGNALKFTKQGEVRLQGRSTHDRYVISIQDTGIGIADKDLPYVFDRFWQAEIGKKIGGTGLGLAIVKGIVEAHGGRVRVKSTQGEGTEFTLEFPNPVKNLNPAA